MLNAASIVLGGMNSKKLAKVSLSDSTIKTCKDTGMTFFLPFNVMRQQRFPQLSQLLVYFCFVKSSSIEKEMLFCRPIETTAKADVFKLVSLWECAPMPPQQYLDL